MESKFRKYFHVAVLTKWFETLLNAARLLGEYFTWEEEARVIAFDEYPYTRSHIPGYVDQVGRLMKYLGSIFGKTKAFQIPGWDAKFLFPIGIDHPFYFIAYEWDREIPLNQIFDVEEVSAEKDSLDFRTGKLVLWQLFHWTKGIRTRRPEDIKVFAGGVNTSFEYAELAATVVIYDWWQHEEDRLHEEESLVERFLKPELL